MKVINFFCTCLDNVGTLSKGYLHVFLHFSDNSVTSLLNIFVSNQGIGYVSNCYLLAKALAVVIAKAVGIFLMAKELPMVLIVKTLVVFLTG